ncbi:MAG: nickel insertion protein, partial [Bryobacteraceae bacterium]
GEAADPTTSDQVWVLETNLDDISGEIIGHTSGLLMEAGALDVYTTAIQMKKNRPGVTLSVLCETAIVSKLEKIIFRETATLGIRRWLASRHKLERRPHTVETPFGPIVGKLAVLADGSASFSPEYESCRRAAAEKNAPLKDVYEAARRAYDSAKIK